MVDVIGSTPWQTSAAAVWAVLVFQALGLGIWRGFFEGGSQTERELPGPLLALFFQQSLGMIAAAVILLVLGLLGLFYPGVVLGGSLVCVAGYGAWVRRVGQGVQLHTPRLASYCEVSAWEWCALGCATIMMGLQVWRFPAAWDDTAYHLPIARTIVEHHGLVANEWLRFPYFPAFMQVVFACGLFVDATLAQWFAGWPVVLTLCGLMGASRWLCGHSGWGVLAWALYLMSPALRHSLGFAYVDASLVLFSTAAVLAAAVALSSQGTLRGRLLAVAGVFAGMAAGVKLHGVVIAAFLGAGILGGSLPWGGARSIRLAMRDLAVFTGACIGLGGFWYFRSYWATGDPVHPAGGPVFGYYIWTAEDLALQAMEQATHGVPKQWANLPTSVVRVLQPYLLFGFLCPLLLMVRRENTRAWALVGWVVCTGVLFWFWVSQVDRYLLPVAPIGALLGLEMLRRVLRWRGIRGVSGTGGGGLLTIVALCACVGALYGAARDFAERPSFAQQRAQHPEIALLQHAQSLEDRYGRTVLNLGYENAFFYYSGQLIGDWFGRAAYPRIADCSSTCRLREAEDTERIMQKLGARLLLVHSEKFSFDQAEYSSRMTLLAKNGPAYLFALR